MKLYLKGHDYKYATEQMMLMLFPGQRPEYPAEPTAEGEDSLVLTLSRTAGRATGHAVLTWEGRRYSRFAWAADPGEDDRLERDRVLQRVLKNAFYRAGTDALGREPASGGPHRGAPGEAPHQGHDPGPHPCPGRPAAPGPLPGLPRPAAAGHGLRHGHPGRPEQPAARRALPLCGHPLLPHPVRLLLLRLRRRGQDPEHAHALRGCPVPGDRRRRGHAEAGGAARALGLLRGRHPHHPVGPAAPPGHDRPGGARGPLRLHRVHRGGGAARHHHGGEALRPARPRLRPRLGETPSPCRRRCWRPSAAPTPRRTSSGPGTWWSRRASRCGTWTSSPDFPPTARRASGTPWTGSSPWAPRTSPSTPWPSRRGPGSCWSGRGLPDWGGGGRHAGLRLGRPALRRVRPPTTSTARSICPAALRTWAGADPAPRASTTSA